VTQAGDEPIDPRDLRASDLDRQKVAELLHEAAAQGRLTLDELQERLATVYAARTYRDLEPVLRDLSGSAAASLAPVLPSREKAITPASQTRIVRGPDRTAAPRCPRRRSPS
jgi:hypothetical protein